MYLHISTVLVGTPSFHLIQAYSDGQIAGLKHCGNRDHCFFAMNAAHASISVTHSCISHFGLNASADFSLASQLVASVFFIIFGSSVMIMDAAGNILSSTATTRLAIICLAQPYSLRSKEILVSRQKPRHQMKNSNKITLCFELFCSILSPHCFSPNSTSPTNISLPYLSVVLLPYLSFSIFIYWGSGLELHKNCSVHIGLVNHLLFSTCLINSLPWKIAVRSEIVQVMAPKNWHWQREKILWLK